MKRAISRYDRLRALVRNPEFLRDLKLVEKGVRPDEIKWKGQPIPSEDLNRVDAEKEPNGFNPRAISWFLKKYSLGLVITPELVRKYSHEVWENQRVFEDDDQGVRLVLEKEPKMVEFKPGFYRQDYSECFADNSTITMIIDLTRTKSDILDKVSDYIDYFKKHTPQANHRKKGDEKIDRFLVWDEYKSTRSFSEIATKHGQSRTAVRKAYLRAFADIMGEQYDPKKHNRLRVAKSELRVTCESCAHRQSCDTLCPEILAFVSQDEVKQREIRTL